MVTLTAMPKMLMLAAIVAGCGGTDDLHEVTTNCNSPGVAPQPPQCEVACSGQYKIVADGSATCASHNSAVPGMQMCSYVATVDGVRGCCGEVGGGSETVDRFFECD